MRNYGEYARGKVHHIVDFWDMAEVPGVNLLSKLEIHMRQKLRDQIMEGESN